MIALPGLTLATGCFESGSNILQTFARFVDRGMLPNVFPGAGDKPESSRTVPHVVTPRIGNPVEINALWYKALVCIGEFAQQLGWRRC